MSGKNNGNSASRSWVYTLNHPTEDEIDTMKLLTCSKHRCCLEVGEFDTPHLQGAITFKRAYRLTQLKKILPRHHWEIAKCIDAENYCIKGDMIINENYQKQGQRDELAEMHTDIVFGIDKKELSNKYFKQYIKYSKGIEKYLQLNSEPRNWVTKIIILIGESGTGKTRHAIENGAKKVYYSNGFFYGAVDAEIMLFDEFDQCDMPRSLWLEITDRYECTVNVKNGSANWKPKKIYFTSNVEPQLWMIGWDDAIKRRITKIKNL